MNKVEADKLLKDNKTVRVLYNDTDGRTKVGFLRGVNNSLGKVQRIGRGRDPKKSDTFLELPIKSLTLVAGKE